LFCSNQILEVETKQALASQDWLNISSESILEFLDMECLINIKEADLVRALIRWGKFQIQQQDRDTLDENLRSKILPGLRKIRFDSLDYQEVAQLCTEEFGEVLTGDEKCSILVAIIKGDWELMPNNVVSSIKLNARHEPYTFFSLPYAADKNLNELKCGNQFGEKKLYFKVKKTAAIVGVKLNLTAPYHELITFSLIRHQNDAIATATGSVNITSPLDRGEVFCPFNTAQTLAADSWYIVQFEFNGFDESSFHRGYVLPKDKIRSVCDGLTLTVHDGSSTRCVHILGIVFSKAVV
jgi:BTB And C-terminal Kelch